MIDYLLYSYFLSCCTKMSITENIIIWHISFSVKHEWISWGHVVMNDYILFLINLSRFLIASFLSCTLWLGSVQECQNIVVEWLAVTVNVLLFLSG